MMDLITIIIPAFNVIDYLERCVHSVLKQTYHNLEIIIVDDGSTDGSGFLCDSLKRSDHRIKVFHKQNGGLSSARNVGLENASGDWVLFLDSDDWIEPSMVENLLNLAKEYQADISSCASRNVMLGEKIDLPNENTSQIFEYTSEQMIEELFTQKKVRFEVWNKLWKRSVIGDTRFIVGQVSEDIHFDRIVFLRANKMVYTTEILHNYLVSRPGNTRTTFKMARMCIFDEFDALIKDVSNNSKLLNISNSIAAKFAIYMYDESVRTKQSNSTRRTIKDKFNKYYVSAIRGGYMKKSTLVLFYLCPELYCKVLKIKRTKKGIVCQ